MPKRSAGVQALVRRRRLTEREDAVHHGTPMRLRDVPEERVELAWAAHGRALDPNPREEDPRQLDLRHFPCRVAEADEPSAGTERAEGSGPARATHAVHDCVDRAEPFRPVLLVVVSAAVGAQTARPLELLCA